MVKPKTKISKQKFLSQITKKPRKCDIKKERKLENQRIRKYQQFLDILNLMWSIVDSVSLEDHINLAETMKDDYILLLLRRPSKKNILDDVLSNIDLTILKEKTLNLLSTSTWKYISLYALMDEKFIFKWSHKIDFFRLKMNEKDVSTEVHILHFKEEFLVKNFINYFLDFKCMNHAKDVI